MEIENILKVSFNESIILTQFPMMKIIENDIEFDNLILMINEIEEKRGLGSSIHKEAFTGLDYMGSKVEFNCYVIFTDNEIYKYKFDKNLIPFNNEILKRNREEKLNKILN
mgnify:FL=1|jgi:hypothetical protein